MHPPEGGAPNAPLGGWATPGLHSVKRMQQPGGVLLSSSGHQSAADLAATIGFGADKAASTHPPEGGAPNAPLGGWATPGLHSLKMIAAAKGRPGRPAQQFGAPISGGSGRHDWIWC